MERSVEGLEAVRGGGRGLMIGWFYGRKGGMIEPQVVVKLLSEKPTHAVAMAAALG